MPTTTLTESALQGRRILVVDDSPLNVRILTALLKQAGAGIVVAHSGENALAVYEQSRPDLVLLDVEMPGMDGVETCRRLKARHGAASAPVIFITAHTDPAEVERLRAAGGFDHLAKPFQAKEVLARIRAHLPDFANQLNSPGHA